LNGAGSYEANLVKAYNHYVKFNGLSWDKPKYKWEQKRPRIPTTEGLNSIIEKSNTKYKIVFKVLMECGMSPIELSRTALRDIDLEKGLLNVQGAKGHSSRTFKLKTETIALLEQYFQKYAKFPNSEWIQRAWRRLGDKTSKELNEPSLRNIRLYDLRHFYGTMLYHKTKDILFTKTMMGHKKIETTLLYAQLIAFGDDEWSSAVAKNIKTACSLIEQGFDYVTEMEGIKIFRKRK
jgi:integrase